MECNCSVWVGARYGSKINGTKGEKRLRTVADISGRVGLLKNQGNLGKMNLAFGKTPEGQVNNHSRKHERRDNTPRNVTEEFREGKK